MPETCSWGLPWEEDDVAQRKYSPVAVPVPSPSAHNLSSYVNLRIRGAPLESALPVSATPRKGGKCPSDRQEWASPSQLGIQRRPAEPEEPTGLGDHLDLVHQLTRDL